MRDTNIKELRQRKADLGNEGRELLTTAEREFRDLTKTEEAAYNAIKAGLQDTEQQIIAWEKDLAKERAQGAYSVGPEGSLIPDKPARGFGKGRTYAAMFAGNGGNLASPGYAGGPYPSFDKGGFESFNDFLTAVTRGADARLMPAIMAGGTEKFPTEGGFAVPVQFAAEMLDKSLEGEIVRPRASIHPMTSNTLKISGVDVTSPSAPFGGFQAQWAAEATSGTVRTLKLRRIELHVKKLWLLAAASNELVQDGQDYEAQLSEALIKGLGWGLDLAFLTGNGAGRPKGVLNDSALITVTKETGQLANTIVYENLARMFARLHPASMSNGVWIANNSAIPQLLQITIGVGTGGTHFPVLRENDGRFFIFTREVLFTEKLPTLGTKGDIILADFSQYAVGLRREVSLDRSMHVGFASDEMNYRSIVRADGQGKWKQAYTPENGDTLSWCVALATRS